MTQQTALNPKQIAFCHEYVVDRNGAAAAIRAGFAERSAKVTASRLLKNPQVLAVIDQLTAELAETLSYTARDKRELLWRIAQECTEFAAVASSHDDDDDAPQVIKHVDAKAAISAIAELNKMDGDLAAIKTENKTTHSFEEVSDAELDRQIAAATAAAG